LDQFMGDGPKETASVTAGRAVTEQEADVEMA